MNFRLKRHAHAWSRLGERNPYGVILTGGSEAVPEWDPDAFFATGRVDAEAFMAAVSRTAPNAGRRGALDFGCGVGRVTRWLAPHFQFVIGVDVAPSMLARARALNADVRNCEFVLNRKPHLRCFETGTFDVVYSRLVLQHVPGPVTRGYIPELIRVLTSNGVLMFQLPEPIESPLHQFVHAPVEQPWVKRALPAMVVRLYRLAKYAYIKSTAGPEMRMFGLPFEVVERIIHTSGGFLLACRADASHGVAGVAGFEYWVGKDDRCPSL